jgi:hypothetical protein
MSKCIRRDSNYDSAATRMGFLQRRPIVARANYLNFCAAAAMNPSDSEPVVVIGMMVPLIRPRGLLRERRVQVGDEQSQRIVRIVHLAFTIRTKSGSWTTRKPCWPPKLPSAMR